MPAVVLEFELPRLPRSWEDGLDLDLELNMAGFDGQVQVLFTTVRFSNV